MRPFRPDETDPYQVDEPPPNAVAGCLLGCILAGVIWATVIAVILAATR